MAINLQHTNAGHRRKLFNPYLETRGGNLCAPAAGPELSSLQEMEWEESSAFDRDVIVSPSCPSHELLQELSSNVSKFLFMICDVCPTQLIQRMTWQKTIANRLQSDSVQLHLSQSIPSRTTQSYDLGLLNPTRVMAR